MTNRYRAGQPCIPQMPIDFAGDEPEDAEDLEQMSADVLAITAWFFLIPLVVFLIAVVALFWSMK